jgi:multidrug efflux pump subunit AcrA (membrane-fusion protein)
MSMTTDETIRELCENSQDRRSFYDGFLRYAGDQTGAVSGIVWDCKTDPIRAVSQVQSKTEEFFKVGISEAEHAALIKQASTRSQSLIVQPKPDDSGNKPSDHPIILISFVSREQNVELVELFLKPGQSEETYRQCLRSLELYCQSARTFVSPENGLGSGFEGDNMNAGNVSPFMPANDSLPPKATSKKLEIGNQLDQFVHRIHRSLDLSETASEVANEMRQVLDCDRVSVVSMKSRVAKILAISGQPSVNRRSNSVQMLKTIAERILPIKKTFWFPSSEAFPPQVTEPLDAYLAESATRSLVVVPIYERAEDARIAPDEPIMESGLIGGLVVEHCQQEWNREDVAGAIETLGRHAGDAYRNAHSHRQLLFYPVWKWLGKSKLVVAARNLKTSVAVAAGLAFAALVLAFWPAQFRLNCDGKLIPQSRNNVFAEVDGTVEEVFVRHGEAVEAGQQLVVINNLDFKFQNQELIGQIKEIEQNILSAEAVRLVTRSSEEKQNRQENIQSQKAQLASLKLQLELVEKKLSKLKVKSPGSGQVVTWNVEELLRDRPVTRGDMLLEVADVDGAWELELDLSDSKVGHLLNAYQTLQDSEAANTDGLKADGLKADGLKVDFILAADPNQKFSGSIVEVGTATQTHPDLGQTVRLKVKIDASEFDIRQVKSGVTAYVHCGKRSLGYVWFHPLWEFVQKKVLFPLF